MRWLHYRTNRHPRRDPVRTLSNWTGVPEREILLWGRFLIPTVGMIAAFMVAMSSR